MNYLARIEALNPDIIENFLISGVSQAIPEDLQKYIHQLSWSMEIWEHEKNINRAAKSLRMRIKSTQGITFSLNWCKQILYDAMNYFSVDCNVSNKFWFFDAADKFANLEKLAIAQDKLGEAGRFVKEGTEYRVRANAEISAADLQAPVFIVSNKMTLEEMGFEKESLKEIAAKDNEGYYVKLITQLPIEKSQMKQLLKDADIQEAEIVEDESND